MIYETIVIAGLILILIAIAGNKKIEIKEVKIGDLTNVQRSIIGVLGIIILILGIWQPFLEVDMNERERNEEPTPTPTLPPVTIEITDPKEGAEVLSPLTVEGTFDGELPEDWYLRMFVYNYEEWYPVNRIEPFEGKWHSKVWLNVGKRDIVVILGDKDADSEFQRIYEDSYFIRILPQEAQVCDRVTVEVRESHE